MLFNSGKKQFLAGWRGVSLFYTHLQRGTRIVVVVVGCLVLLTVIYLLQGLFNEKKASADLAKFYPAKCLGGWQYTAHAENVPDLDTVASIDDFNDINSAVLDNAMAQLYCSEFNGEDPIGTVPKKLTLRLSLGVKPKIVVEAPVETGNSAPSVIEEPVITTEPGSGSETPTTEVPGDIPVSSPNPSDDSGSSPVETPAPAEIPAPASEPAAAPVAEPSPAPVEAPAPAPAPSAEPTGLLPKTFIDKLFAWFTVGTARAQEAVTESPVSPEIVPVLSEAPVLSGVEGEVPVLSEAPTAAADNQPSPTVETGTEASSEPVSEASSTVPTEEVKLDETAATPETPVMPSDALLEVSYTLDGQTWKSLGWVAESSWRDARFELPLDGISDWSNLDWLQVRFDRVASIDANQPVFYLDGMWLEGEYDALENEEIEADLDIDQPDLKKDKILKQKIKENLMVINVLRRETNEQELWYRDVSKASSSVGLASKSYWKKITISDNPGVPVLLDIKNSIIFWVSYRQDNRMMLHDYRTRTGNTDSMDVVPGGLSVMEFAEMAADGSGMKSENLYFLDDGKDSYYFSD